jgi:2-polyprenyl-3-methyl-5-hydroxy-6-metoxy-1,4-benzoquinol methylase
MSSGVPVFGWKEGQTAYTDHYLHDPVIAALRAHGARQVLDAGCGNGGLCAALSKVGLETVGVDADGAGIKVASADFPGIRFEECKFADDIANKQWTEDGLFDAVVSTEVVEHLYSPHELPEFAFRALRPGGILIISTPYHGYLKNIVLALSGKLDKHFTALWHGGHIKFWSRNTLTTLIEREGLKVEGFVGAGRFPYLWKSMILIARKPR